MTITEFLTARLDEIENVARSVQEVEPKSASSVFTSLSAPTGTVEMSAAYVLADVAAKRRLVELCATWMAAGERLADGRDVPALLVRTEAITAETVLRALAQPYAEHPDFDESWKI